MAEFKTPTMKKCRSRLENNSDSQTPIKIPASPFLQELGYGSGIRVFTLERSPKVGFIQSPWAIKKRNTKLQTKNNECNERIRLEADILRKLNHENIVGFRALTETLNGDLCLAMEKLDISLGDMIEDRLDRGDNIFPAKDILKVGYEMSKGLEYLHHVAHILHGDIKSYNVLVSKDFKTVKLCDFGVSLPLNDSLEVDTLKFSYIGTECWNAPEIIFEDGPVTNKTDMWAYGLVLWEMIALSPPHVEADSITDSMYDDIQSQKSTDSDNITSDNDIDMDDSFMCLKKITKNYGHRPPLPAIDISADYAQILDIFYICTTNYKYRPNAKDIVKFFVNHVYSKKST